MSPWYRYLTATGIPFRILDGACVVKDTCTLFPASMFTIRNVFWSFVTAVGWGEDKWKFSWKVPDIGTILTSGGNPVESKTKNQGEANYQLMHGWFGLVHTTGTGKEKEMQRINSKFKIWYMICSTSQLSPWFLGQTLLLAKRSLIVTPHLIVRYRNKDCGMSCCRRDVRCQIHVNKKCCRFRTIALWIYWICREVFCQTQRLGQSYGIAERWLRNNIIK